MGGGIADKDTEMELADIVFDLPPTQPFVEAGALGSGAEIGALDTQREACLDCSVDKHCTDATPPRSRLHPYGGNPRRKLRALLQV
jgi:hypothetical protein